MRRGALGLRRRCDGGDRRRRRDRDGTLRLVVASAAAEQGEQVIDATHLGGMSTLPPEPPDAAGPAVALRTLQGGPDAAWRAGNLDVPDARGCMRWCC